MVKSSRKVAVGEATGLKKAIFGLLQPESSFNLQQSPNAFQKIGWLWPLLEARSSEWDVQPMGFGEGEFTQTCDSAVPKWTKYIDGIKSMTWL